MTRLLTDTPVTSDEEEAVITRSSTFPRLCVASVTFCLKLASDRTSRRALACGSLSPPYRTLKSPTMMMPDFVPTHSTSSRNSVRKVANGWELRLDDGGRYMTNSRSVEETLGERNCRSRHSNEEAGQSFE